MKVKKKVSILTPNVHIQAFNLTWMPQTQMRF